MKINLNMKIKDLKHIIKEEIQKLQEQEETICYACQTPCGLAGNDIFELGDNTTAINQAQAFGIYGTSYANTNISNYIDSYGDDGMPNYIPDPDGCIHSALNWTWTMPGEILEIPFSQLQALDGWVAPLAWNQYNATTPGEAMDTYASENPDLDDALTAGTYCAQGGTAFGGFQTGPQWLAWLQSNCTPEDHYAEVFTNQWEGPPDSSCVGFNNFNWPVSLPDGNTFDSEEIFCTRCQYEYESTQALHLQDVGIPSCDCCENVNISDEEIEDEENQEDLTTINPVPDKEIPDKPTITPIKSKEKEEEEKEKEKLQKLAGIKPEKK